MQSMRESPSACFSRAGEKLFKKVSGLHRATSGALQHHFLQAILAVTMHVLRASNCFMRVREEADTTCITRDLQLVVNQFKMC